MGLHDGHRERMKRRFREHGADNFDDHQLLELFLFYCKAREDTNPLAHRLLERFGSLAGVFDASWEDLLQVEGVGEHAATAIHLMPQLMRRYELSRSDLKGILYTTEEIGAFLKPYFFGARNETVYMICLDAKGKVLNCSRLGEGTLNSASLPTRRVVETALVNRASAVVLAHNHTSGIAIPSHEDVAATRMVRDLLEAMGVELLDHLVMADDDFTSMRQSGLLAGR